MTLAEREAVTPRDDWIVKVLKVSADKVAFMLVLALSKRVTEASAVRPAVIAVDESDATDLFALDVRVAVTAVVELAYFWNTAEAVRVAVTGVDELNF